jgi:membrane protein implicated in regulation of membrane protease activity
MKFLYDENRDFKETGLLFSEEEVRSHIDHYFQDSHYYFQSFIDREPLNRRQALALILISTPLVVWIGLSLKRNLSMEALQVDTAISCALFAIFCVMSVLGWTSFLQTRNKPDESALKEKGKQKQKFVARKGATKREIAYDHLLQTGLIYEGKIAEIINLSLTVRQISFHFGTKTVIKSGAFVTESSVGLELYDTLVVLSDGAFTVLI